MLVNAINIFEPLPVHRLAELRLSQQLCSDRIGKTRVSSMEEIEAAKARMNSGDDDVMNGIEIEKEIDRDLYGRVSRFERELSGILDGISQLGSRAICEFQAF